MRATLGLAAILCVGFLGSCQAKNEYPIVMMHGLMGWGRDERLGDLLPYWGMLSGDMLPRFNDKFTKEKSAARVFAPAQGPLSSTWDRTCEAFAQIKGTKVDYGEKHASEYVSRYGRDYTNRGYYPEWGEINNKTGMRNKIHLVGHSMGGLDSNLLTHLLNNGSPDDEGDSALFQGNNDWIASVTSLASPHDGTPLATFVGEVNSLVTGLVAVIGTFTGGEIGTKEKPIWDLKLDQHGLSQEDGESSIDYIKRAMDSKLFKPGFKESALYDMTPDGAYARNKWMKCVPNVHYMSWSTVATKKSWFSKKQIPIWSQLPLFSLFSFAIGRYTYKAENSDQVTIDDTWWKNDGLVPLVSAKGSHGGENGCVVEDWNGKSLDDQTGKWVHLGTKDKWDHTDITGLGARNVEDFYFDVEKMIHELRAEDPVPCTEGNGCDVEKGWEPRKGGFGEGLTQEQTEAILASALAAGPDGSDAEQCASYEARCPADATRTGLEKELCAEMDAEFATKCAAASSSLSTFAPAFSLAVVLSTLATFFR